MRIPEIISQLCKGEIWLHEGPAVGTFVGKAKGGHEDKYHYRWETFTQSRLWSQLNLGRLGRSGKLVTQMSFSYLQNREDSVGTVFWGLSKIESCRELSLVQWLSTRADFALQLCLPWPRIRCWHLVGREQVWAKCSARRRTTPTAKNYLSQNVNHAKFQKPSWNAWHRAGSQKQLQFLKFLKCVRLQYTENITLFSTLILLKVLKVVTLIRPMLQVKKVGAWEIK